MDTQTSLNFEAWDWLPGAALEVERYLARLMEEPGIKLHDLSGRAKSIMAATAKQDKKNYHNPMREMTDIVAARIITYSTTDRNRAREIIKDRFVVKEGEDRNPGTDRGAESRGYDCLHLVVTGEKENSKTDWMISNGKLAQYFSEFGGLEIQIRTVAGHAWAEFEHARRYKGKGYPAINDNDRGTIDNLFRVAADTRSALDETFVAIDRLLARPSTEDIEDFETCNVATLTPAETEGATDLDHISLAEFLEVRYPDDSPGTEAGLKFGVSLANACKLLTVESLKAALAVVDSAQVINLMDVSGPVTRVRRLDDDLLARYRDDYIDWTKNIGNVGARAQHVEWRFEKIRGKLRMKSQSITGADATRA